MNEIYLFTKPSYQMNDWQEYVVDISNILN